MIIENTSDKIVNRMIANEIISDDDRAIYSYHLQVILETVVGHAILLTLAALAGHFIEVALFLLSFNILRSSTSGYHCKTNTGCILLSAFSCALVVALENSAMNNILLFQWCGVLSMMFLLFVGAINHPNMGWSDEELKAAKKSSRTKILILLILLPILDNLGIEKLYLYSFVMGIVQCAISLLIVKLGKGGQNNEANS